MEPFAEPSDLEERWRPLSASERGRAEVLLGDASALLSAEFRAMGRGIGPGDSSLASNLRAVCCSMVRRVMANDVDGDYTQASVTAGSFSQQYTFANPAGDMYLTAQERRLLGIPKRRMRIGFLGPFSGASDA